MLYGSMDMYGVYVGGMLCFCGTIKFVLFFVCVKVSLFSKLVYFFSGLCCQTTHVRFINNEYTRRERHICVLSAVCLIGTNTGQMKHYILFVTGRVHSIGCFVFIQRYEGIEDRENVSFHLHFNTMFASTGRGCRLNNSESKSSTDATLHRCMCVRALCL